MSRRVRSGREHEDRLQSGILYPPLSTLVFKINHRSTSVIFLKRMKNYNHALGKRAFSVVNLPCDTPDGHCWRCDSCLCVKIAFSNENGEAKNSMILDHQDKGGGNTEQAFHLANAVCAISEQPD